MAEAVYGATARNGPGSFSRDNRLQRAIHPVHDRMPVLLMMDEYDRWLRGSFDDLLGSKTAAFPTT